MWSGSAMRSVSSVAVSVLRSRNRTDFQPMALMCTRSERFVIEAMIEKKSSGTTMAEITLA